MGKEKGTKKGGKTHFTQMKPYMSFKHAKTLMYLKMPLNSSHFGSKTPSKGGLKTNIKAK